MQYLKILENELKSKEFSFELLNDLKDLINKYGLTNEDFLIFNKLLLQNIEKESLPLSDTQIKQIANICSKIGYLHLKDILFIDGVAFVVLDYEKNGKDSIVKLPISSIYKKNEYTRCDFLDITNFFSDESPIKRNNIFLSKLRDELDLIFVNFYNIHTFPKRLGKDSAFMQELAIKYDKEEVINGLNNDIPFRVSFVCNISNTEDIRLTELEYNPTNERLLSITKMDVNALKLSNIIQNKEKVLIKK